MRRARLTCVLAGVRGGDCLEGAALNVAYDAPPGAAPILAIAAPAALALSLDEEEYRLLRSVAGENAAEAAAEGSAAASPTLPPAAAAQPLASPAAPLRASLTLPELSLALFHAPRAGGARPLAALALGGVLLEACPGEALFAVHVRRVHIEDLRTATAADLRAALDCALDGDPPPSMVHLRARGRDGGLHLSARLAALRLRFNPDFLAALARWLAGGGGGDALEVRLAAAMAGDVRLGGAAAQPQPPRAGALHLSPGRRLLFDAPGAEDEVVWGAFRTACSRLYF